MKYLKYCLPFFLLVLIITSSPLIAQQSIGFSDSTDFQYIIDYRLPDWGYSNFYIENASIGTNGQIFQNEDRLYYPNIFRTTIDKRSEKESRFRVNASPTYQYYRESEERTLDLRMNVSVNASARNNHDDIDRRALYNGVTDTLVYDLDQKGRDGEIGYNLNYSGKHFLIGDFFFLSKIDANLGYGYFKYDREHSEQTPQKIYFTEFNRRLDVSPQIGIGFGRLRNVSPQLRALRMNERYKSLGNTSLSQTDIITAAEQFTKIQGYQRTTDRYRKYFWGDMNQLVSNRLNEMDTYDLFYLTDVLNENLGQRFEGFEVFLSTTFHYQNRLERIDRTEDGIDFEERNISIDKNILTNAELRWFKNLSLNHQISFETHNEIRFPLETESSTKWILNTFSDFSWLWTITDKYLITTSLSNRIYKPQFKQRFQDADQYNTETYLSGQFTYFIENKLALSASASLGMETFDIDSPVRIAKRRSLVWGLSAGIRYYFGRNLF